jgi:hypothetical protein
VFIKPAHLLQAVPAVRAFQAIQNQIENNGMTEHGKVAYATSNSLMYLAARLGAATAGK